MNLPIYKLTINSRKNKSIKIITGLNNFNLEYIVKAVKAAELGNATYVDISCNPDIVRFVKSITNLPICVSSIEPQELYLCSCAGADIIEIGNFDCFYDKKIYFNTTQILNLTREVCEIINNKPICVTIPHYLSLNNQIKLAFFLKQEKISYLQTEGYNTKYIISNNYLVNSIRKGSSALSSTYLLNQYFDIPIISASGLNLLSSSFAIPCGGSIIAIGTAISKYKNIREMTQYIDLMRLSVNYQVHINNLLHNRVWHMNKLSKFSVSNFLVKEN
uniref:Uncharacterized protein ycf23 n=1 Tax=Gastroclonium compressum TaxID=1852973 RepID=A0A173FZW9_GASCM|nr:hypothetical chloroplast RF23 [Coeloseira compressa]ANH09573.1 hypothetical chloroplast RF23 [Coeloseira compressa]